MLHPTQSHAYQGEMKKKTDIYINKYGTGQNYKNKHFFQVLFIFHRLRLTLN